MQPVALGDLEYRNNYLIDLGSTLDLFGPDTDNLLSGNRDSRWPETLHWWRIRGQRPPDQLSMVFASMIRPHVHQAIEVMVTADQLAVDEALLEGSKSRLGFDLASSWVCKQGILAAAHVPLQTRQSVRHELAKYHSDLVRNFGDGYPSLFHAGDKRSHDHLFANNRLGLSWFANSNEHPLRALYYLRLSEISKVNCFLSKGKRDYIDELLRVAKEISAGRLPSAVPGPHEKVRDAVLSWLKDDDDLLPPIAEIVLVHALKSGKTPGNALLDVRNSAEAREYRNKLRELRWKDRIPTVSGRAEVEKYLHELRELGKIWVKDPHEKVLYDTSKVEKGVSAFPVFGALLAQILPNRAMQILGTSLTPPNMVHLFISRWFRREGKAENLGQ